MLALGIQAPLATSGNPMEGNVLLCQVRAHARASLEKFLLSSREHLKSIMSCRHATLCSCDCGCAMNHALNSVFRTLKL